MKPTNARSSAAAATSRVQELLPLLLVLLAAVWLHRATLRAPLFADDYLFLDLLAGRPLWRALLSPDPLGNYLRPLSRQLWFWLLSGLSGGSPAAFHAANLGCFLVVIVLFWSLVRRALGAYAGLFAASLLAVQHAADVPVLWASGSQDLLAVCLALAALHLVQSGRRLAAALVFLLALLAKEVVAFTPLVALAMEHRPGGRWRESLRLVAPMLAALGLWAAGTMLVAQYRPLVGLQAHVGASEILAPPIHLLQTVAGIEWGHAGWTLRPPPWVLLGPVAAVLWQGLAPAGASDASRGAVRAAVAPPVAKALTPPPRARDAITRGALWALLGALPVIMVAGIWSAYYFLFAVCGATWSLAAVVQRWPPWLGALLVAVLGWTCDTARRLPEFATASYPWNTCSHLNRHYLERGMAASGRYLEDLKRARPTLPSRSTVFFSRLPFNVAFQAADGPLVRWAYRDTSLRSYFLTRFRLADARRGPVFFFQPLHDSLHEVQGADSLQRVGLGLLLSDAPAAAGDVWRLEQERSPAALTAYRLAWIALRLNQPDSASTWLARAGANPDVGPAPETASAYERASVGDTARAIAIADEGVLRHALNPGIHALLADLLLVHQGVSDPAVVESYAAWILAPQEPASWRRWGIVCYVRDRDSEALAALDRYFALAGSAAQGDTQAVRILGEVRRRLPVATERNLDEP